MSQFFLNMSTRRLKIGSKNINNIRYVKLSFHERQEKHLINKQNIKSVRYEFNSLDNDTLSKIFEFIDIFQLCKISLVSKIFNNINIQNAQWRSLYLKRFNNDKKIYISDDINSINWKNKYIKSLRKQMTNKVNTFFNKILYRSKINHTLPQTFKLLNALNIEYTVYINNNIEINHDRKNKKKSKKVRSFEMCDVLKITNNSLLSQFSLKDIKNIRVKLKSNKFFECVDICFNINLSQMIIINNINNKSNNIIQLYSNNNIHFAIYDENNIAFIVIGLNHYQLLSKISPKLIKFDRMSYVGMNNENKYKFYGWKCQIMFRNLKKIFFHCKFYDLIPIQTDNDKLIEFKLIGNNENCLEKIDLFPLYPWKCDTFKGKEIGVFEIDLVLLNDKNEPLFAKSIMINCVLIKDLYNFNDQSNNYKRYLFKYKNEYSKNYQLLNMIKGNIIENNCNLENVSIFLNL